ncbi:MAG: cyclic nucleotide-binding domain-containing protein [Candidatus Riflebacteria bacterium]|nr:cyclic nucleotide-binding domain-containing protein [Candidatus Riflebacteria bacterium]
MKSWMRDYSSGSVIFQEGEPGNVAFILTEGSVEITVGSGDKKKVVTVFKPVSVFGEMALVLKDQKRTATAVARSDSKVAVISKQDFDEFLEKSPKLIGVALTALVHRLRTTTERLGKTPICSWVLLT